MMRYHIEQRLVRVSIVAHPCSSLAHVRPVGIELPQDTVEVAEECGRKEQSAELLLVIPLNARKRCRWQDAVGLSADADRRQRTAPADVLRKKSARLIDSGVAEDGCLSTGRR